MRVRKFDVAHYRHQGPFVKFNQVNAPEIALHDIINARALSLLQFLRVYGLVHGSGTLSVTATITENRFMAYKDVMLAFSRVLDEARSVVLLDERH